MPIDIGSKFNNGLFAVQFTAIFINIFLRRTPTVINSRYNVAHVEYVTHKLAFNRPFWDGKLKAFRVSSSDNLFRLSMTTSNFNNNF